MRVEPVQGMTLAYFQMAADEAKLATCTRARCGSVIVKDGVVLAGGFNAPAGEDEAQRKCEVSFDKSAKPAYDTTCCVHAEWNAILNALKAHGRDVEGSTLYFMRVDDAGNFTGAGQPFCTVCSRLSLQSGIAQFVLWHADQALFYDTAEYNLASYAPYESAK